LSVTLGSIGGANIVAKALEPRPRENSCNIRLCKEDSLNQKYAWMAKLRRIFSCTDAENLFCSMGVIPGSSQTRVRIGPETGRTTTWLWTQLKRLGLPAICIDARYAKAMLQMQINKCDRHDAVGIARNRGEPSHPEPELENNIGNNHYLLTIIR
jgi:hypothetical protein